MTTDADIADVALIGGGFSGLMTLRHLVGLAGAGEAFTIIEPGEFLGRGLAYSTTNPHHLLNVPAGNMTAFPDEPEHLLAWLGSQNGRKAAVSFGIERVWQAGDYVPRCLFARYLGDIAAETFSLAKAKGVRVQHVRGRAVDVTRAASGLYKLSLEGGQGITSRAVVLATGNLPSDDDTLTDPWRSEWGVPKGDVGIIGTGLTTVDTILSLRDAGFKGKIFAASRHGLLPRVHDDAPGAYNAPLALPGDAPSKLSALMWVFRTETKNCMAGKISWQRVFDRWRPHIVPIWEKLNVQDKKRFLKRLYTFWGVHRHRMAPQIGAVIRSEIRNGELKILHGRVKVTPAAGGFTFAAGGESHVVERVFDCRGPCPDVSQSGNTLISNLYRKGLIERHDTGWGLKVSGGMQVMPEGADGSFLTIGPPLVGERLETIAVPELRQQARDAAIALSSLSKKETKDVKISSTAH